MAYDVRLLRGEALDIVQAPLPDRPTGRELARWPIFSCIKLFIFVVYS